jgi:hypothetical protein
MIATVISLVPCPINIDKPGLIPREQKIPKSDGIHPQVLHVEGALHYVNVGEGVKKFPVRVPADEYAQSIVNDYLVACLAVDLNEGAVPALFWALGKFTIKEVETNFKDRIVKEIEGQEKWLMNLVKMADDDWQKLHRHTAISDLQRMAAHLLKIKDRDWILQDQNNLFSCPACRSLIQKGSIRCSICTTILDHAAFEKFNAPLKPAAVLPVK